MNEDWRYPTERTQALVHTDSVANMQTGSAPARTPPTSQRSPPSGRKASRRGVQVGHSLPTAMKGTYIRRPRCERRKIYKAINMTRIEISTSDHKDKKFKAVIDNKKTVHFGAQGASDFTIHKSEERKQRYVTRHRKREDWSDPETAGFYAKRILWNKPTIQGSIKDTNQRFKGLRVTYKNRP